MFSHFAVGSADLDRSRRFYDATLLPLGCVRRAVDAANGPRGLCWIRPGQPLPRFYVFEPGAEANGIAGGQSMVAFLAPSPQAVEEAFQAAMSQGGQSESAPGPRPEQGEGYFGACLRDPDGNKVHLAFRGDVRK